MTDQPVREPFPADTERDRSDESTSDDLLDADAATSGSPNVRPSAAEGAEDDAGERPPRPSQAEGDRGDAEA